MRKPLFEQLKTIIRFSDIADAPFIPSGEDPSVPYAGHEGEMVVIADDGETITFDTKKFDVVCFYPGTIPNGQLVIRMPFTRRVYFPDDLPDSSAVVGTAPTSETIFSLQHNGGQFATMTFAAGIPSGEFATVAGSGEMQFDVGDVLTVQGPDPADATAANLGFTLNGERRPT